VETKIHVGSTARLWDQSSRPSFAIGKEFLFLGNDFILILEEVTGSHLILVVKGVI